MQIGSLCTRHMAAVSQGMTVADAAALMCRDGLDELLVTGDDGRLVGILTDRDIVREVVARRIDPDRKTVGAVSAPCPITAHDESCENTVRLMALYRTRRIAVADGEGRLVGVITLDDLLPCFAAPLARLSEVAANARAHEPLLAHEH